MPTPQKKPGRHNPRFYCHFGDGKYLRCTPTKLGNPDAFFTECVQAVFDHLVDTKPTQVGRQTCLSEAHQTSVWFTHGINGEKLDKPFSVSLTKLRTNQVTEFRANFDEALKKCGLAKNSEAAA